MRIKFNSALIGAILCCLMISFAHAATYTPPANNRIDTIINTGWKFNKGDVVGAQATAFNDAAWSGVTLPHTINTQDAQSFGLPPGYNDSSPSSAGQPLNYWRGISWYRKHVTIPSTSAGRSIFLQFDGADIVADVYMNGQFLGQHKGGWSTFRFNATAAAIIGGDNVIAVKVDSTFNPDIPPLDGDYAFDNGLYRDVHLVTLDKLHVRNDSGSSGIFLKQTNVSAASANLQVTAKLWNDNAASKSVTVNSVIVDAANNIVKTLTSTQTIAANAQLDVVQNTTITTPHLWNGRADPYLYKTYVEIKDGSTVTDLINQPLGFRFFSMDPDQGFFLNGHHLQLHGVDKNQDRLDKGFAISKADMDEDMAIIKDMGVNFIRVDHYPNDQHFYDLCDQAGMVIWAEGPLNFMVNNTQAFNDNTQQQFIELVRQNYNHPSIVFWSVGNEILNDPGINSADPGPIITAMNNLIHAEDPTRITTWGYGSGGDRDAFITDTNSYNLYYGWYRGVANDLAGWADAKHAKYPTKAFGISEYGVGGSINFHRDTPVKMDHSEEYQASTHETEWKIIDARPFLLNSAIWSMFDFATPKRQEGDHLGRNDKGMVTYDRKIKKDVFYWYKANWSTDPFVHINSSRYAYRPSATTDIKVYSNTDSVELIVNGVSLGSKTSTDHIYTWSGVNLSNAGGSNTVQAIGTKGGNTYTDNATWYRGAIRIDVGSDRSYIDSSGKLYVGDTYYPLSSGGEWVTASGLADSTTRAISNTTDDALYQSYRYGNFTYKIPVENGTYDVYMKFIDPKSTGAGQRVFSVTAEGVTILSNYDIFAAVGANAAVEKTAVVTVTDNAMSLSFTPSVGDAILSGLALIKR